MPTDIEREKLALLEALSLYEQHCGSRGGADVLRRVRALQFSLVSDEQLATPSEGARTARAA